VKKKVIIPLFLSIILILVPAIASAHPGRTDSKGGHYCRTNCAKWGLKTGEYHYHNGGSKKKKSSKSSINSNPATSQQQQNKIG
jgi:competence protein ComEC